MSQIKIWYKWNDHSVSSQIVFILTRTRERKWVKDSRAVPNICTDTDHRPVCLKIKRKRERKPERAKRREILNLKNLGDLEAQRNSENRESMEREYCKVAKRDTGTVEEEWRAFRDKLIGTVERESVVRRESEVWAEWQRNGGTMISKQREVRRKGAWKYGFNPGRRKTMEHIETHGETVNI